jgi:iron(III) transport system ATP-binding protein
MKEGRIVQIAPPPELYRSPADPWIAGFLGDADFVEATARNGVVETAAGTFATPHNGKVLVMFRPERVVVAPQPDGDAIVVGREYFGHDQLITVVLSDGTQLRSRLGPAPDLKPGERVGVKVEEALAYPI